MWMEFLELELRPSAPNKKVQVGGILRLCKVLCKVAGIFSTNFSLKICSEAVRICDVTKRYLEIGIIKSGQLRFKNFYSISIHIQLLAKYSLWFLLSLFFANRLCLRRL